jgi:2-haloacid dehalogenase
MLLKDFRLLSFACFGTLIDRDTGIVAALRPLAKRSGKDPRREDLLAAFARHETASLDASSHATFNAVLADAHARLSREWGTSCSDEDHRLFARSITDWPAFADTAGSLQYLKRYFRLAVVSNGDRETIRTVSRQLDVGFDVVCSAEEAGAFEPERRAFDVLLARAGRLGVAPGKALHVTANLPHDLAPVEASGLACAWLNRDDPWRAAPGHGPEPSPDRFAYVFRSLAHLVRVHQEQLRG